LADKILYLINRPDIAIKLSINAIKIARKRHNPDVVAERTIKVYKDILRREGDS
jgi:glycosyltransferase involved in cell wall biosynthesis